MPSDVERFATVPLFEGLTPEEIAYLLRVAEDVPATEGDVLIRDGDQADAFYVIAAGAFEVRKKDETLARLEDFSYFGEMSLCSNEPRSATVVCVRTGRLKKFSIDTFQRMIDSGNKIAYKVLRSMCRILAKRLARLGERLVS